MLIFENKKGKGNKETNFLYEKQRHGKVMKVCYELQDFFSSTIALSETRFR